MTPPPKKKVAGKSILVGSYPEYASVCTSCLALGFTIGALRSQLEGHDGEAVRRQPPPPGLALPLRELNPED